MLLESKTSTAAISCHVRTRRIAPSERHRRSQTGGDEGNRTLNPRLAKMGDHVAQGLYQQQRPRGASLGAPRHRRSLSFRATRRATTARGEAPTACLARGVVPSCRQLAEINRREGAGGRRDAQRHAGGRHSCRGRSSGPTTSFCQSHRHEPAQQCRLDPVGDTAAGHHVPEIRAPCDSAALLLTQVRWEVRPGTSERSSLNVMEGGAGPRPTSRSDGGQDRCGSGGARLGRGEPHRDGVAAGVSRLDLEGRSPQRPPGRRGLIGAAAAAPPGRRASRTRLGRPPGSRTR